MHHKLSLLKMYEIRNGHMSRSGEIIGLPVTVSIVVPTYLLVLIVVPDGCLLLEQLFMCTKYSRPVSNILFYNNQ